jgi:hypothetical protein
MTSPPPTDIIENEFKFKFPFALNIGLSLGFTREPRNPARRNYLERGKLNLLAPELFFFNFSTPVYKM